MTWIVVLLLAAALVLVLARRRHPASDRWLPASLREAGLAYAERTFRSQRDRLVARLDRAYRRDDRLYLVEFKTRKRHRIYPSDIIELSAQRVALEAETGEAVDDVAYVVTQVANERQTQQVHLLARDEVRALVDRKSAIESGTVRAKAARHPATCRQCAYRAKCHYQRGERP